MTKQRGWLSPDWLGRPETPPEGGATARGTLATMQFVPQGCTAATGCTATGCMAAHEKGRQAHWRESETSPAAICPQHSHWALHTQTLLGTLEQATFTTRSVPQVTISPRAMSMDMWEMLCFPSWKVAREVRLTKRREKRDRWKLTCFQS